MYPDQVRRIRDIQQGRTGVSDAKFYRRDQAAVYMATRFKYRYPSVAEYARIEYWVEHGGRRPWGI